MNTDYMRYELKKQYKGAYKWVNKVNKMSDAQVAAIYKRMVLANIIVSK